jgi:3-dehydroquinate dehydratase/shikimate dehydrogenase
MAKVCLCLTGKTIARDLQVLEKYRPYVDVAELRVDFLEPDERFHIRRFPELAGIPTILTIRRRIDGGKFIEGEGARIILLASGLAFADADRRRNFAYVDLEEDLQVPSLEEAARTFGTRIIRSIHDFTGVPEDLEDRLRRLRRSGDEIAKAAVMPRGIGDTARVFRVARETAGLDKIILAMGPFGLATRILAERMGSILTFASPRGESDLDCAGPGQLDPVELAETYRFRDLKPETRVFGIIGSPLAATASPAIHNPAFAKLGLDSVYLPLRIDDLDDFDALADELAIDGVSVTVPHKENFVRKLAARSVEVNAIAACNTAVRTPAGWTGYNTDAAGFSESLLAFIGRPQLRGRRLAIIGAGGVACAVAAEAKRLGAKACVLNRTAVRAKELAERFGFAWGSLDERGLELLDRYSDIIVQTTSAGMEPNVDLDPLELYRFKGREIVMDLIYKPAKTKLLARAEAAGCAVLNGYDMLERQARLQFKIFTGSDFPD